MKVIGVFGGVKSGEIMRKILEENKDKLDGEIRRDNPWLKFIKDKSRLKIEEVK